jgi:oligoendopeptidase F
LADYLALAEDLGRQAAKLYFYAMMSSSVNAHDTTARALLGQILGLYAQLQSKTAFAQPELLAAGREAVAALLTQDERLSGREQWLDDLFRQQAHVLSREVEEVMGLFNASFRMVEEIFNELANTDLTFPDAVGSDGQTFKVTQATIGTALESPDRALRRSAWNGYADSYLAFKNTFAQTYLTHVRQKVTEARLRRYESVLHMALDVHNLPTSVFHNLIDTFKANLHIWQRFWDVKRRVLKQKDFRPYDIWAPMTDHPPAVPFEQAVEYISAGMALLGSDYVRVLREGCLEQRWVDRAVNVGKRQGAFSYGTYDTMPFIMMSYDDSLGAMSTLAHELGHSLHSYHTNHAQPYCYSGYSMFLAEVASNFNQAMTRAYLFQQPLDRDFKLALIQEAIDNFHRYFFIMPTLARFEFEVYSRAERDEPLTTDTLLEIMRSLYAEGYGTTMIDDPERTAITWAQFQHLYEPYYTFQYATGISAAHAFSADIRSGVEGAAERYLGFLRAGRSAYPLDVLRAAGVDMTTPAVVEKTYGVLAGIVDQLESLID